MYSANDPLRGLDCNEKLILSLRRLYSSYGYSRYRMSKFEEYDFYSRNKDFLVSEGVITFTDTDGKLMALKPDVTLSIVKNSTDRSGVRKLYYDENVYRVSGRNETFREIKQAGLECIGDIDLYCMSEVLTLAAHSLNAVSERFVLDVSHLGIITALVDRITDDERIRSLLLKCVGEKNTHGIDDICFSNGIDPDLSGPLKKLVSLYGEPHQVISGLSDIVGEIDVSDAVTELEKVLEVFSGSGFGKNIRLDFSTVGDPNYYCGIVFKGYIDGVPGSVLSGGCYDKLMNKLGRNSKAIGFALYLDMLERLYSFENDYDADIMLVYDDEADIPELTGAVRDLIKRGYRVYCTSKADDSVKRRFTCVFKNGKVEGIESLS